MAIQRYSASADTTIANAFQEDLVTRATGSNMGYADALEVFSIYGQESGSNGQSQELSRILIQFDTSKMTSDRAAGRLGASGSVSFFLKLHNARTPYTLPQDFTLVTAPLSKPWNEGTGLDLATPLLLGPGSVETSAQTTFTTLCFQRVMRTWK